MAARKRGQAPERKRSLLLYMAGDNDLSDAGLRDVAELCQEGASEEVHVGVEIDTRGEHTGSIRYEITLPDFEGRAHRTVIERLSEQDTGKPKTLRAFLKWSLARYPADERVLVLGGHGSGFRTRPRAIGVDEFGSALDIPEIEWVLRRSGISAKSRLSIMGFDACLMCMLEIAHHFAQVAHFLVGSQQTEPAEGWPYGEVLKLLKSGRKIREVAEGIPAVYARNFKRQVITNVTQSAIDLAKTDDAMARLSELGESLSKALESGQEDALRTARRATQSFALADYVDAVHLAENLQDFPDPAVSAAAKGFREALASCILRSHSEGAQVANANGLSVWYPAAQFAYIVHRPKYVALRDVARRYDGWIRFLDQVHRA